jgi:hypothetical protein
VAAWLPAARFCAARRLNQPASVFFAVLYGCDRLSFSRAIARCIDY